ncbi:MAG: type IV secretion system protein [Sphingomonadales bacterium]|nr:type IV secretion system protein [Sphingomonadales bacterium]
MTCPAIITGDRFLLRVLAHIDCQTQNIGTFGYQSLAQPGSTAAILLTGLLTLFIALYGIRLLFGGRLGARDIVHDVLKVGIALTLAFSWPAFSVVVYDVVVKGPAEIAASFSPPTLPDNRSGFADRLQSTDKAIVDLTAAGTGRNTGALLSDEPAGSFAGSAFEDYSGMGWARLAWLASVIGSLALLRLIAGLLLALAPLAAGMLLFDATRGLFAGWLRGLVLAMVGAIGATIVLGVELSILEPWLADALRLRALGYATPATPIELLAITLSFALVQAGMIWLLAKIAFTRGWVTLPDISWPRSLVGGSEGRGGLAASGRDQRFLPSRAEQISASVERVLRREEYGGDRRLSYEVMRGGSDKRSAPTPSTSEAAHSAARLGSSWRRTTLRSSGAKQRRDMPS